MLFYAAYKDTNGAEHANLYSKHEDFFKDTFSPECEILVYLPLKISGKTYKERKTHLHDLAVEYQLNIYPGLSYGELAIIDNFFERNAKRYGLIEEFRENCII